LNRDGLAASLEEEREVERRLERGLIGDPKISQDDDLVLQNRPPDFPEENGGCWGIRTHDPLIKSQLLYQLS
jgi:hypothetical protein